VELPFELHVALRYLLAKRKQAFISLISLIGWSMSPNTLTLAS